MPLTVSKQPRKQRKALYKAPHHKARKLLSAHLDEALLLKYDRRSLTVVVGDTVKVLRGSFKGHTGKVAEVDVKARSVTVEGITNLKADGTKVPRGVDASNLVITKLNLADPYRREKLVKTAKVEDRKELLAELAKQGEKDKKALEESRKAEEEEREKKRLEREAAEAEEEEP